MDKFASICELRGLDVPVLTENKNVIATLSELVLRNGDYTIPVFASFGNIALPIATEWVIGNASSSSYPLVFDRLSMLAPLISFLQPLTEHLLLMKTVSLSSSNEPEVIRGIIRLLIHDHGRFSRYFSATELRGVASDTSSTEVRTLALAALALLMEVSENVFDEWVVNYCGSIEPAHSFKYGEILDSTSQSVEDRRLLEDTMFNIGESDLDFENTLVTKVGGVFLPRIGGTGSSGRRVSRFVKTETSALNLQRTAKALLTDRPLLLMGDHGSGKTSLVEYLHDQVRGGDLVRIHLGDQTDAKALVGTYTSGQKVGTFEWTPGVLTSAVRNGSWVLIEDIDRAPGEIVSTLLSLLSSRELVIPSRNQVIKASPGFQIIATTSARGPNEDEVTVDIVGARSWVLVPIKPPTNTDLEVLAMTLKPFLTQIAASMLITVFRRVEEWQENQRLTRKATTRDLVKLVHRAGKKHDNDDLFREAVFCFGSFLPDRLPLAHVIADSMGIADSQVEPLLNRYRPSISISEHRVVVGHAELERRHVTSSAARNLDAELQASKFALTQPTLHLLEEIASAVAHSEPVLLVGETGTGKTAVVQHLAKLSRRKLVVINVSQQVETSDLVGGFKPVDARQLSGTLLEEFEELFDATFSRAKNHQFLEVLEKTISKHQWTNMIKLLREAIKMANSRTRSETGETTSKRARIHHASDSSEWNQFSLQLDAFERRLKSVQQTAQFQFIEGLLVRAIRQGSWVLLDELNLAPADTIEGIGELLSSRQLTLLESGGKVVESHPAFRLFANMNPATDVGKRDLPFAVRSQFTEIWSASPEKFPDALNAIVQQYLPQGTDTNVINDVSQLYIDASQLVASHKLVDGAGQRPHFSIRTLSRALTTASLISRTYGIRRALFEAFSMCFLTLLDSESAQVLTEVIETRILDKLPNKKSALAYTPPKPSQGEYVLFGHWWMPCGQAAPQEDSSFILTGSVYKNLLNLTRAASTKMFPILIQGPTSSGKTSMITYLAKKTGHTVVRINNHEHTDLAEYLGGYESDNDGRLVFREGALVKALREGHWLILDELNLAPTDVLEALNRLLDDNRELLVPETQEIIKPHTDFILFATQNPPGLYAGRKVLSRAFRNRFLELHFGDIPEQELETILRERSGIAPSYAAKIVEVYRELARQRIQKVFEQTATLRDLFRWARRPAISYEELAFNGFTILGERSRSQDERSAIKSVIEKVMRVQFDADVARLASRDIMNAAPKDIVWTRAMRRILALVEMAIAQNEPVLLVGETGCGKTTIVQALAAARAQQLITLNAHQNTETGDLVGSQRPVRSSNSTKLFEWVDGPLVKALRNGSVFLLDEISLADDSVLERLNSVLETERTLFVPEIGTVIAEDTFQFFATMNPGGDYGKKELSPALRNRFTEIWCPAVEDESDLRLIISTKLSPYTSDMALLNAATECIVRFSKWFSENMGLVSLRDVLSWIEFVGAVGISEKNLAHGACMVFVDGLGTHLHLSSNALAIKNARNRCISKLSKLLSADAVVNLENSEVQYQNNGDVSIGDFSLKSNHIESAASEKAPFSLAAPTSALNAMRVARAMQVRKPVLLEGSPGAGKTSLVSALAHLLGQKLTRINLSDQTDLSDLFGQDVPLDEPGKFGWRSAPFLRAMQHGEWVLLDEMNLAPQPVLEGLNACLDHRGEAYIPELDRTFAKHPGFTVFAAQNPQSQGGGRKGLPKSFMNRFTLVYVDQLGLKDLYTIAATTHPKVAADTREKLATYVEDLATWASARVLSGGPFEFNLRDTLRWLDLVQDDPAGEPQKFLDLVVLQRLRTPKDRADVLSMFSKYFPEINADFINPVEVTSKLVKMRFAKHERTWSKWLVHDSISLLPSYFKILETGVCCISRNWPLILAGPSGRGKTSIIRLLSQLCGSNLREFAMTPDVDSTDLLGEFDQLEYESELQRLWGTIDSYSRLSECIEDAEFVDAVKSRDLNAVTTMLRAKNAASVLNAIDKFNAIDFTKPMFHWVDGMLIQAIENGDWLVLDNANLCSPAVLDRLNSLLERGGYLMVNECARQDGSPRVINPHPNFRLFLTVNPRFGELSRAMRNRGVEVWIEPGTNLYDESSIEKLTSGGALPLQFSSALTMSRLSDIPSHSWLRSILLNRDQTPVQYLMKLDAELAGFAKVIFETYPSFPAIDLLHKHWLKFTLENILTHAMKVPNSDTLLGISALQRTRDNIECEYDVYGFIVGSLPILLQGDDFASVLLELAKVRDPSRIPVFREWCLKYAADRGLVDLEKTIQSTLGKKLDFSGGGCGMELIWQKWGRPLGFSTEEAHSEYQRALQLARDIDSVVARMDLRLADSVADIRRLLSTVTAVDERLLAAASHFRDSVASDNGNEISHANADILLSEQFVNVWKALGLVHALDRFSNDRCLTDTIIRLSQFSKKSTVELKSVLVSDELGLRIPNIEVPQYLETTLLEALQMTRQGRAQMELAEFANLLALNSRAIVDSMDSEPVVSEIVQAAARHIVQAFSAAEQLEGCHNALHGDLDDPALSAIALSQSILFAYVHPLPLDPAIAQHVWYEHYLKLANDLEEDKHCWQQMKEIVGSESAIVSRYLDSREVEQQPVPSIYRPGQSIIGVVHSDMLAAAQLARDAAKRASSVDEIDVILSNADHLRKRLERATEYRDLTSVVMAALALLKLGLSLKRNFYSNKAMVSDSQTNLWLLDPTIVGSEKFPVSVDYPILVLHSMECSRRVPLFQLQELLMDVFRRWTLERLKVEEQQRERNAGFRYNDDEAEDAIVEREFRRLFPDYDEKPELPQREDDFVPGLVDLYCKILISGPQLPLDPPIVDTLVNAAEELTSGVGDSSPRHLPALYLALRRRTTKRLGSRADTAFNFYLDYSSEEMKECTRFAASVLERIRQLLHKWPEHDTLQTIERVCEDMLALPPHAPVALLLSKTEQAHHNLYEWDRFASKEYKVSDLMANAASLIVRWRRLELATWPALFAVEKRRSSDSAAPFWFHLFETLVVASSDDVSSIMKVLILFMAEAPIGQFERRLTLLTAFKEHIKLLGNEQVFTCISNVLGLYSQYAPMVKKSVQDLEVQLRKDVEEIVRLASWRDVNVHALKQSAQRSHRQLFKIVKKFRTLLDSKIDLTAQNPAIDLELIVKPDARVKLEGEFSMEWVDALKQTNEFRRRSPHLQDLSKTSGMISRYTSNFESEEDACGINQADLWSLAKDVEARASNLRNETPKVWSKENKKTISALQVEKQQLLTETLRELKRSGLRSAVNKATVAEQLELTRVLANAPVMEDKSDDCFYRLVEMLPQLRSAVSEASSNTNLHDLSISDLHRGLALAENAFSLILRLRAAFSKHHLVLSSQEQEAKVQDLVELAKEPRELSFKLSDSNEVVSDVSHMTTKVVKVVAELCEQLPDVKEAPRSLMDLQFSANAALSMTKIDLRTKAVQSWLHEVKGRTEALLESLSEPRSKGLLVPVVDGLNSYLSETVNNGLPTREPEGTAEVETIVNAACQKVLLVVQELVNVYRESSAKIEKNKLEDDGEEDKDWLISAVSTAQSLISKLRAREIWSSFEKAFTAVCRLSVQNALLSGAYAANLLIFVRGYRHLTEVIETLFLKLMRRTSAGCFKLSTLLLTLATEGFCSPQPTEDDSDDEADGGDGVGLGDGQGGQSSSKDINEDDDDVAEAIQTSNPDQQKDEDDGEEEDKAMEIEGDMAGETEDLPPQSSDDEDEQDDEEELDEEIGDLDELDPNAVDEKMWDDQTEDPKEKEKETSQSLEGNNDEDLEAQGNEDERETKEEAGDEAKDSQNDEGEDEGSDGESDLETHDDVNQGDHEDVEEGVEQKEALDLPEDMQLDDNNQDEASGSENDDDEEDGEDAENMDDSMGDLEDDNDDDGAENKQDDDINGGVPEENVDEMDAEEEDADGSGPDEEDKMDVDQEEEEVDEPNKDEAMDHDTASATENAEAGGEEAGADIEGVEAPDADQSESTKEEQSTTTDLHTAKAGQGSAEEASSEQDNVSSLGGLGAQGETQDENDEKGNNENLENVKDLMKQLGDAMKEFHRRQKDIKERNPDSEPTEEDDKNTASTNDDLKLDGTEDLEHVGKDDPFDTQALGKSTNENERQQIDEQMAIDDETADDVEKKTAGDEDEAGEHGAGGVAEEPMLDEDEEQEEESQAIGNANTEMGDADDTNEEEHEVAETVSSESNNVRDELDLWQKYEAKTHDLALILGEQLRLILEPTVTSKLKGDYRTGKRLNMKRIIPYIASEFKKDKIWLRRTKPAKREYQIMLALDNSKSMGSPAVVDLAFQAITLVGKALNNVEAGQVAIAKFGSSTEIVHSFEEQFTPQAGNAVFRQFCFDQERTNVHQLLQKSLDLFKTESKSGEQWKLEIIVSDGITDDHAGLKTLVHRAYDERVMVVFIVLDALNKGTSILDMKEVKYNMDEHGNTKLEVVKYMEDFPFDHYVIVQNIQDLPMVLASVLRQYFQAVDL